jgi:23S rRNA pseudouridine2605 synthase
MPPIPHSQSPAIPRRLSKRLADATTLSHQEIEAAIAAGRVCVGGEVELRWERVVMPDAAVTLDGALLVERPPSLYAMLHKPAGVVSTRSEPGGKPCLAPWLDALGAGSFPVGRLDAETTGLILLTDDGDLAHALLRPERHVSKEYHLRLRGELSPDDPVLSRWLDGVDILDNKHLARALSVRVIGTSGEGYKAETVVAMELGEGRYHQVRKMCRAVKVGLLHLHRARMGPLSLGDLAPGQWRHLDAAEVEALWEAGGGRAASRAGAIAALIRNAQAQRDAALLAALAELGMGNWEL